jgi:hypothetical protein
MLYRGGVEGLLRRFVRSQGRQRGADGREPFAGTSQIEERMMNVYEKTLITRKSFTAPSMTGKVKQLVRVLSNLCNHPLQAQRKSRVSYDLRKKIVSGLYVFDNVAVLIIRRLIIAQVVR